MNVVIDDKELAELIRCKDKLSALEAAGVGDWDGYSYAMECLSEYLEEFKSA